MDIKYSNLSKEPIIQDIQTIVENQPDSRWKAYYNSKYGDFITDIFASTLDVANYNINRRFEESFNETAKLDESQIMLSHDKGYDIQRSIPSKTRILPSANNINNFTDVDKIILHAGTSFNVDSYYYTLTKDITVNIINGNFSISTSDYNCLEGVFKNDTVGKDEFSAYMFNTLGSDKASNLFGSNIGTSDDIYDFCKMSIGEVDENGNDVVLYTYEMPDGEGGFTTQDIYEYKMERVLNYNAYDITLNYNDLDPTLDFDSNYELNVYLNDLEANSNKVLPLCYVRTSRNKMLEVCFGDGRVIRFPRNDLKVKYFVSNGSIGNKALINRTATLFKRNATVYINGDDEGIYRDENTPNATVDTILNNLVYTFDRNSISGIDMETIEEISVNMDSFFSMQDRLVDINDYNAFFNRGIYKPLIMKFWGEQVEQDYFQDITPYNSNTVMINYKGVNDDIFENNTGDESVELSCLIFNNIDGFATKYYIDDLSVTIPSYYDTNNKITLSSYRDYLYMYFLRELLPLKLLSKVKNDGMKESSIANNDYLVEMNSIIGNTGNLALNYTYIPSINYSNVLYNVDVTIQGSKNSIQGIKTDASNNYALDEIIKKTIKNEINYTRGLNTSKLNAKLYRDYKYISNIVTTVTINETETTVSDIINDTENGNNIFEDMFITFICGDNKSLYNLFSDNNYFTGFPSINNLLGFSVDSIRLVEGFKNRISARRLSSIYREVFRFIFVMQMNGYMNSLTIDDIYTRVNNFYEFVESKMKYDVVKNLASSNNSLDYTNFTLPNEFIDVSNNLTVSVTYKSLNK